jgi:hypothetical protein
MKIRQTTALAVVIALASAPIGAVPQQATLGGIAKKEAKKPYADYVTRARNVDTGVIAGFTNNADPDANFEMTGLPPASYLVELLNSNGKVICVEGPFDVTKDLVKNDIEINCHHMPAGWWLLGVAGAAGATAGAAVSDSSPSR